MGAGACLYGTSKRGAGHIGWPSQLAQGKFSTGRLGKGPITACIGQAAGIGHTGWPSQLAQGKLSTGRLGKGPTTACIGQAVGAGEVPPAFSGVLVCTRPVCLGPPCGTAWGGVQGSQLDVHKPCR